MKSLALTASVTALVLGSSLVVAQSRPADLLPPGFDDPAPSPSPTPSSAPPTAQPDAPSAPASAPSGAVVQPIPVVPDVAADPSLNLDNLPTIEDLEELSEDELDELLGLKPRYDVPPALRRTLERVGVIDSSEGGLPQGSLAQQPAALVRAALAGTQRPLVSRWGHILLRRVLASRMAAPSGMNPVEFVALRAGLLNRLGEHGVARALVQDVDAANYDDALLSAAYDAYVGTADLVGACPAVRLSDSGREDTDWQLLKGICLAYGGEETRAARDIQRLISRDAVPRIDGLLAQRFAGAAGAGQRAVNVEWDDVEELTPLRFALANAVREDVPEELLDDAASYYTLALATAPMMPVGRRAVAAQSAAAQGILSSSAMIDLYSQIYAADPAESDAAMLASRLREGYVGSNAAARMAAISDIWDGDESTRYGRQVLTAYAAARLPPSEEYADRAAPLIASMLSAGLDRDAMRWAGVVSQGSEAWGLLAVATPEAAQAVTDGQMADFLDQDGSSDQHKSKMLLAGLNAMGRLDNGVMAEYSSRLEIDLTLQSRWTRAIAAAADAGNPALVSLLAGLGMQGSGWDKMTALHLYHIVRSLNRVGLGAEARMIAAEAVARA